MSGQLLLKVVVVVAGLVWLGELVWLWRQTKRAGEDPLAEVSGAAIFFVLALPVATRAPDLVDRVADFWKRGTEFEFLQRGRTTATPRLIIGGKSFLLTAERVRIGRYANNDLVLDHPTVSAYHAEVLLRPDGRHELRDSDSRNGTRINGTPVRSAVLRDGDQITLGALSLHYVSHSATERGLEPQELPAARRRSG